MNLPSGQRQVRLSVARAGDGLFRVACSAPSDLSTPLESPEPGATVSEPALHITCDELLGALRELRPVLRKVRDQRATLSYRDGVARFALLEAEGRARADGDWPGSVQFAARVLAMFLRVPPAQDPVTVRFDGEKLRIANVAIKARWMDIAPEPLNLPVGATLLDLGRAGRSCSPAAIDAAGLTDRVSAIESEIQRELVKLAAQLPPADLSLAVLRRLAEDHMNGRPPASSGPRDMREEIALQERMAQLFPRPFRRLVSLGFSAAAFARGMIEAKRAASGGCRDEVE